MKSDVIIKVIGGKMYPFYEIKKNEDSFYFTTFISDNLKFPPHLHSYVEMVYIIEGEVEVTINEKIQLLKKGEIGVAFPNDIHSYDGKLQSKAIIIIFSPEIINGYFSNKLDVTLENPYFHCIPKIYDLLKDLVEEANSNNNEFIIKGILYILFGKLSPLFKFQNKEYNYSNTVQIFLRYIASNFTENITLEEMSKSLGFSKFYISRIFTKKIGFQFNEYINKLRINMAQSMLIETEESILNIALECGFDSQRNFNRVFKKHMCLTPTQYRKNKMR